MNSFFERVIGFFRRDNGPGDDAAAASDQGGGTGASMSDSVCETLECLTRADDVVPCIVRWRTGSGAEVDVEVPDADVHVAGRGVDLFGAFVDVRTTLERRGYRLVCAGARCDCWPSGMARQMGAGETAYVLTPGHHADLDDRVDLFAPADPAQVCTVKQQRAHYQRWLDATPDDEPDDAT